MSERLIITLTICGTLIFVTLMGALTLIAIHEGDGTENTIVIALLGLFGSIITGATGLIPHFLQAKNLTATLSRQQQTP